MHLIENNLSNVKNNNQTLITLHAKEKEKYDIQRMEVKNAYEEHTLDTKNNYSKKITEIKNAHDMKTKELNNTLNEMSNMCNATKQEIATLQINYRNVQKENGTFKEERSKNQMYINTIEKENKEKNNTCIQYEHQLQQIQQEYKTITVSNNELSAVYNSTKLELQQLQSKHTLDTKTSTLTITNNKETIVQQQEQLQKISTLLLNSQEKMKECMKQWSVKEKEQLHAITTTEKKNLHLTNQLANTAEELKAIEQNLEVKENAHSSSIAIFKKKLITCENKIKHLKLENQSSSTRANEIGTWARDKEEEIRSSTLRCNSLNVQVDQLTMQKKELENQLVLQEKKKETVQNELNALT